MMRDGTMPPDHLYQLAVAWGRTRHEMEYEKRHPGATVSYDAKAQAEYTKDLLATIGAMVQEQEVAPLEEMTEIEPARSQSWWFPNVGLVPKLEPEPTGVTTTMEVSELGGEAIPTQRGIDEDDPLFQALEEAEAEEETP